MRHSLLVLPLIALLSGCVIYTGDTQQAWGQEARRSFNLSGFDKVDVSSGMTVTLVQGPYSIEATGPEDQFHRLVVEKRGDTLVVSRTNEWWGNHRNPRFRVTVSSPNYSGVQVSSGSNVKGDGLSMQTADVHVSSGASLGLSGTCTALDVDVSSGASFTGNNLRCETARVDASSGASASAFATRAANGDASSGASITFHGRPAVLDRDTSSGGSVRAL